MSRLLTNPRRSPLTLDARPGPDVRAFHRRITGYAPTALVEPAGAASAAGVARLFVKAETERFGLPAFKALGASWATYRVLVDRLGSEPSWSTLGDLGRVVRAALGALRLVAATDGNHGRAVAWLARELGLVATIFVPAGTARARIDAIAAEGAEVVVVEGTYDDAVAASAAMASATALVVSDTSWPGYDDVPGWVIDGYSTIFTELDEQLEPFGGWETVDVVVVPLGVGAFGAAAAAHLRAGAPEGGGPLLVGVEPDSAACVLAAVDAGHVVDVPGPHRSIMAGLNCGTASMVALPLVTAGFDAFVTIDDDRCRAALAALAAAGLDVGECGAAGIGALAEIRAAYPHVVAPSAAALVIATEGVTDPANFAAIVGRPPR